MDDFSKEFCNWEKLREQRSKIKTEINKNLKNLYLKDLDINKEYKDFMEYKDFLVSIRDYIDKFYEEFKNKKEVDKLFSLIEVYCYLSDIEFSLTQIRLNNIYINRD